MDKSNRSLSLIYNYYILVEDVQIFIAILFKFRRAFEKLIVIIHLFIQLNQIEGCCLFIHDARAALKVRVR